MQSTDGWLDARRWHAEAVRHIVAGELEDAGIGVELRLCAEPQDAE